MPSKKKLEEEPQVEAPSEPVVEPQNSRQPTLKEWEDGLVSIFSEEHHKITLREWFVTLESIVKEG